MAKQTTPKEDHLADLGSSRKAIFLMILFSVVVTVLMGQLKLDFLESYLYDLRVKSQPFTSISEQIELVYITPGTIQANSGFPTAKDQTQVLERLLAANPQAIVYDFPFEDVTGDDTQKNLWESKIIADKRIYIAGRTTPLKGEEDQLFLPEPLEQVLVVPAPKTTDQVNFAKDGVTRRMILTFQNRPLLPVKLAGLVNPDALKVNKVRGRFDFYGTDQAFINFKRSNTYPSITFEDIQNGNFSAEQFANKIILIGTDLEFSEAEYILTPFSREVAAMTRIEMLANIIDTLIQNNAPIKVSPIVNWALIFLAAIAATFAVMSMTPSKGLAFAAAGVVGFVIICFLIFWGLGFWIPMAAPIITLLLCYYLFLPYRLIVENRRTWEYFQKHKILIQVEELKSNFISMMSHDLKTPIARIQGMTDVILADDNTISHQQRDAVDTIKQSSDDLLKFINAILSYGKIESQGVQLNLLSLDVNKVIDEVVRKHEFLARVKRIQIICELEPLFPILMDSELMKQVFSNLVENAIKYSPEDTKILVTTEELHDKIVVQVADQGPGIPADELQNIFMKFFRSKNVKSSPIKGSGLGLYLARYFTELHKGQLFVESTHGNGSTFTVELPLEQGGPNA